MKAEIEAEWRKRSEENQRALKVPDEPKPSMVDKTRQQMDQDASQAKGVVTAYWKAVGNRDVKTAFGMWVDDLSPQKRDSLQMIIQAKESLDLLSASATVNPPNNATVDFDVRYKDEGAPWRRGSGTFALRRVDGSWKIESIARWSSK